MNADEKVKLYLTRSNLTALLGKLDINAGFCGTSACTLIKRDNAHPKYPNSHAEIEVKALEDDEYYTERRKGPVVAFKVIRERTTGQAFSIPEAVPTPDGWEIVMTTIE